LPKDGHQVAGYKQPAEELLAGHPKDGCQVVGISSKLGVELTQQVRNCQCGVAMAASLNLRIAEVSLRRNCVVGIFMYSNVHFGLVTTNLKVSLHRNYRCLRSCPSSQTATPEFSEQLLRFITKSKIPHIHTFFVNIMQRFALLQFYRNRIIQIAKQPWLTFCVSAKYRLCTKHDTNGM